MKSIFSVLVLTVLFATSAHAAKFKSITKMKSANAQLLAEAASRVASQEEVFGDASSAAQFSYTRKPGERALNTVKQLNHARAGIFSGDDAGQEANGETTEQLIDGLFYAVENMESEYPDQFEGAKASLMAALALVRNDPNLRVFSTAHGDEDGSWGVLNILDEKNSEILLIKIGFSGT